MQLGSPGNLKLSKTNIYFKFVHINTWCSNISTDLVEFALNVAINEFVDECCNQWNLKIVDWIKYSNFIYSIINEMAKSDNAGGFQEWFTIAILTCAEWCVP